MNAVAIIARKEAGDLLRSPRGLSWLLAMAAALSAFSLLLISDAELSLLDNAEAVYGMCAVIMGLGALLAIVMGVDTVAGEKERGSLVPLLVAPVSRDRILFGKLAGIAMVWAAMYLLALPYLWAAGGAGQNLAEGLVSLALMGTPVVLGFGFLAMGMGARLSSTRSALMVCLVILLLAASPVILGPSLRQTAVGRIFDWINPLSVALNALDAVIIDSQAVVSQWLHWNLTLLFSGITLWFARDGFYRTAL